MVKYKGEFVVSDIANNKKYLADLLFGWDVGDDLSYFTLFGLTNPTVSSDGWIDCNVTSAGLSSNSGLNKTILNTIGEYKTVFQCKLKLMADNTSTSYPIIIQFCPAAGDPIGFAVAYLPPNTRFYFTNNGFLGNIFPVAFTFTLGQEYLISMVMTQSDCYFLIDNVLITTFPRGRLGNATPSSTPLNDYRTGNKIFQIDCYTNAVNDVIAHCRFRDIKIGVFRGESSL